MSLIPGTRIGVYEVAGPLGEGGMGQVYRACDIKLDRDVAIKILPDAFARDADRLARFTREAKTLAALPSWSPDGEEIAFTSDRSGNFDIWVLSAAGGEPRPLTTHTAIDTGPNWSPDGKWIGFYSARSGAGSIWRMPAAGGPVERATADERQIQIVGWSPDAQAIHVIDETGIRAVTVADGRERSTMSFRGRRGSFVATSGSAISRDGRFAYFIWREDQGDIWLMDVVRGGQ